MADSTITIPGNNLDRLNSLIAPESCSVVMDTSVRAPVGDTVARADYVDTANPSGQTLRPSMTIGTITLDSMGAAPGRDIMTQPSKSAAQNALAAAEDFTRNGMRVSHVACKM